MMTRNGSHSEEGSFSRVELLRLAPDGPLTTLGRNISMCGAVLLGVVVLVLPALKGASIGSVMLFAAAGLALIAAAGWNALRWRWLVRAAARDVQGAGALAGFAFSRADLDVDGTPADRVSAGWLLVHPDRLTVCIHAGLARPRHSVERQDYALRDIVSVSRRNETSMSYGRLDITVRGGLLSFILTPTNGSGMRGPREAEIESAAELLRVKRALHDD